MHNICTSAHPTFQGFMSLINKTIYVLSSLILIDEFVKTSHKINSSFFLGCIISPRMFVLWPDFDNDSPLVHLVHFLCIISEYFCIMIQIKYNFSSLIKKKRWKLKSNFFLWTYYIFVKKNIQLTIHLFNCEHIIFFILLLK